MTVLAHRLDRTLVIRAARDTVFQFFSESARWADWWGLGSTIEARPGGRVYIRHPNGIEVQGEVLEVQAPERIVFCYGFVSGAPIPLGGSRVTLRLDRHPEGTLLQLTHEFAETAVRDEHVQGWRYQLSRFANAVAAVANAEAPAIVDRWFAMWSEPDAARRNAALAAIATPETEFRDTYSAVGGTADLEAHLAAVHRFMPGLRLQRRGDVRHCQWHVLADWVALAQDGQERGRGTNLFVLDADQRIVGVTGFWAA